METLNYKNYTIKIEQDTDPLNPRTYCENLGSLACFHQRYALGDPDLGITLDDCRKIERSSNYISLPVYLYDHSGLRINTTGFSCPWDSGRVGIIYVSKERAGKELGWKRLTKTRVEQIEQYLRNEVKEYDQFLSGDVWGYTIEDNHGQKLDSCWGFYGQEYCIAEAKSYLDYTPELLKN